MALINALAGAQGQIEANALRRSQAGANAFNVMGDALVQNRQNKLAQSVGGALARNDLAGGARAAFQGGDIKTGLAINDFQAGQQQASQEQQNKALEQLAIFSGQILSLPPEQQEAAYRQALPQLQSIAQAGGLPLEDDGVFDDRDRAGMRAIAARFGKLPQEKSGGKLVKAIGPDGKPTFVPEDQAAGMQPFSQPLVQIDQTQQKAEDKAFGKDLVSEFTGIRERAQEAEGELTTLRLMHNTLREQGLETGAVEPLRNTINAVANSLGVPVGDRAVQQVVDAQTFKALSGQILASRLAAQKGPQTDEDARRMMETLAGLDKEEAANDFLLRAGIALRSREIEQRNFYQSYRQQKGTLDGAAQAWQRFKEKVPLFGFSPKTNRPVFFTEFLNANEDAPFEEVVSEWTEAYAPG